jgi:hypothetical protein
MEEVIPDFGPKAEPWEAGKVVFGHYVKQVDVIQRDGRGSKKYVFTHSGLTVACWGTALLDRVALKFVAGKFYVVMCKGKEPTGNGQYAWKFSVMTSDDPDEIEQAIKGLKSTG